LISWKISFSPPLPELDSEELFVEEDEEEEEKVECNEIS